MKFDVRNEGSAKAAVQAAMEAFGRLDVLVNNAGYGHFAPLEQMFRDVIETCLFGVVYTIRAAMPVMRAQRSGHIFQVSSIGGRVAIPGSTPTTLRNGPSVASVMRLQPKSLRSCEGLHAGAWWRSNQLGAKGG